MTSRSRGWKLLLPGRLVGHSASEDIINQAMLLQFVEMHPGEDKYLLGRNLRWACSESRSAGGRQATTRPGFGKVPLKFDLD